MSNERSSIISSNSALKEKQVERDEIERLTQEYLKKGGKIKNIENGLASGFAFTVSNMERARGDLVLGGKK